MGTEPRRKKLRVEVSAAVHAPSRHGRLQGFDATPEEGRSSRSR
jgi:hypothetical protein